MNSFSKTWVRGAVGVLLIIWLWPVVGWIGPLQAQAEAVVEPDGWSFQPLKGIEPPLPEGIPSEWRKHPIDRFVYARLQEAGLKPSPPAGRREMIRRVTYDLTGLPPTPSEVRAFLRDETANAYEKLVDRLLASPHYGEQWARHWMDVVRFGESTGFERNVIIDNLWPFRDYLIESFNEGKPFDRLIREHLAGDQLAPGNPDVEIGTAFLVAGPYDNVGNQDPEQAAQIRANTIDEMIRTTSEAFLGLTVGCARCHDHKFDPIQQADYYRWYATFAGVQHGSRVIATEQARKERRDRVEPLQERVRDLEKQKETLLSGIRQRAEERAAEIAEGWTRPRISREGTEERFGPVEARFIKLIVEGAEGNPYARSGYRIDEFEVWSAGDSPRNVALSRLGATAEGARREAEDFSGAYSPALTIDGKFGARWIAHGPELLIRLPRAATIERIRFSSDGKGDAGDHPIANFVSEYRIEVSTSGEDWREVAHSRDRKPVNEAHRKKRLLDVETTDAERTELESLNRRIAEVNREINEVPGLPSWWAGQFKPVSSPTHIFRGGNPQRLGKEVVPASLQALEPVAGEYELAGDAPESGRREALADWIVSPDNPLTPRVLVNRLWHYHFGQGIVATPSDLGELGGDPSHRDLLDWLARQVRVHDWRLKPLHRMIVTSQAYRQASDYREAAARQDADSRLLWRFPPRRLEAEEVRDTILAVAGVLDKSMGGPGFRLYRYLQDNVATYVPLDEHGPETYRRAVYHQDARAASVDLLSEFDCPDNSFPAPRRGSTTTPLQALTLMNHSFTVDMAEALAGRLERETGRDQAAAQIERAFSLAYGRPPEGDELEAAHELITEHGLPAFCRALLNSNELIYLN